MSSGQFETHPASFVGATGALGDSPHLHFYSNRRFQELRATLRGGIEARKGLILFTGETGRGKTMLLHRVIHDLQNDVTFVVQSDPGASFSALLHLLARNLNGDIDLADRLSLLQSCKHALRWEANRGGAICLVIDNAERLRDDTLECVLQNFLRPATSADRDQHLLQIILAGRPELRDRLLQPRWRSLAPAPGLVCEIESLSPKESAEYIHHRLQAGHLPPSALPSEAIERIAAYGSGDLRLTNSICSGVVALAARASAPRLTIDLVDQAARDLGRSLGQPAERILAKPDFDILRKRDEAFRFQLDDGSGTEVVGTTFLRDEDDEPGLGRRERKRTAVRIFFGVVFLAASFIWLRHQFGGISPWDWSEKFKQSSGASQSVPAESVTSAELDPLPLPNKTEALPPPSDQRFAEPAVPQADGGTAAPLTAPEKLDKRPPLDSAKSASKRASLRSGSESSESSDRQLEMEIYKAIGNRAIMGVAVSVNNGTAYLEGRVATERQRRAAERAARSVEGVEQVLNRILVS